MSCLSCQAPPAFATHVKKRAVEAGWAITGEETCNRTSSAAGTEQPARVKHNLLYTELQQEAPT
jgi:hypothetical protein